MTGSLEPLPQTRWQDHAYTATSAAVSAVPFIGGPAQVLFEAVLVPGVERRRVKWLQELADLVNELVERLEDFDPANLETNEGFISGVIAASNIALGTHLEEKLEMLKNVLARLALGESKGDFLDKQMFRWIDELSPEHFIVLEYLRDPRAWFDAHDKPVPNLMMGSPLSMLESADIGVPMGVVAVVLHDLGSRNLAQGDIGGAMSLDGMLSPRIHPLGAELLAFVRRV